MQWPKKEDANETISPMQGTSLNNYKIEQYIKHEYTNYNIEQNEQIEVDGEYRDN